MLRDFPEFDAIVSLFYFIYIYILYYFITRIPVVEQARRVELIDYGDTHYNNKGKYQKSKIIRNVNGYANNKHTY